MKKLLYTALALTTLVGCNKENDFSGESGDGAVQFASKIVETRASGTDWGTTDEIGITMYSTGTSTVSGAVENIGYEMSSILGNFEPMTASETIYYPANGDKVDFVAYYPYTSAVGTTKKYSLDVTTQTTQSSIDFMLSNNLTNKGKSTSAQVLNFEHKLSNIVINAKAGGTLTDANLAGMVVKVKGTKLTATYDMTPSATTPIDFGSAVAQDVTLLYSATVTPTYHAEGILIPQSWTAGGVVLEFTLAGLPNPFEVAVSDTKFESGKKYTYNVTVTPQKVILDVATITDWTAGNGASGEDLEATPPPYITVNGIKVAKGNLVADGNGGCKIGAPTDGGLYFQFGSLVGWAGGANGDGTGRGTDLVTPALSVVVKPASCTKSDNTWLSDDGDNKSLLDKFYFNYSANGWTTGDIRGFNVSITNDSGSGTLASGRYAALGVGDPCSYYLGDPWRLPNKDEFAMLFNSHGYPATGPWTAVGTFGNGETGSYATHTASGLTIPASGVRYGNNGSFNFVGSSGYYWSSSVNSATHGYLLFFVSSGVNPQSYAYRSYGFPVRCIQE